LHVLLAILGGAASGALPVFADAPRLQASTGSVRGTVTTRASVPRPLRVTFDQRVCGAEVPDQSILIDAQGRLANVVATLVGIRAAAPPREVTVVNERCTFVPRVQVAGRGATMKTSSRDAVLHTTTVQVGNGRQLFDVALPVPGLELAKPLDGSGPLRVGCSTHQWMRGWIVVTDDVAAVTASDGTFVLPNVPPGTYTLKVWHEALAGPDATVTVAAGKVATVAVEMR
jgi:hypothetical protein